jgi:hypothetical protein
MWESLEILSYAFAVLAASGAAVALIIAWLP